jgi:DNA-binding transcriptional MerR regulator
MQFTPRSIAAADADRVFTSRDVSRIAQISLRQLQWWDERKLISPRQEGHKRVYLPEEVTEIMVVAELRRKGLSPEDTACRALSAVRDDPIRECGCEQ